MRTLRSLEALPASSRTSAVRYSVGFGGMERGPEVSVRFRFLGSGDGRIPNFPEAARAGEARAGDGRTKDGSGVDGGGGADATAGGSAVLLVGGVIEGHAEVRSRFAKSSCWRWAH
jgi:hypothetical protein